MANPRYLFDQHVWPALASALIQQEPAVDILFVGDPGVPPCGTLDPDLLIAADALGRVLVTQDQRSMPQHLADHFAAGRHTHGVVMMRQGCSLADYLLYLLLFWHATTADEWIDRTDYIPY
jgi:hypothetical protein